MPFSTWISICSGGSSSTRAQQAGRPKKLIAVGGGGGIDGGSGAEYNGLLGAHLKGFSLCHSNSEDSLTPEPGGDERLPRLLSEQVGQRWHQAPTKLTIFARQVPVALLPVRSHMVSRS